MAGFPFSLPSARICYNDVMIKIVGKELWRGGKKIGWVEDKHIRSSDDTKLGYFSDNTIYGEDGHKLAAIKGDNLYAYDSDQEIPLETISEKVQGGVLPEIVRCAAYVPLGD